MQTFKGHTRIGNWSEELDAYAAGVQALLEARRHGTLASDRHSAKLRTALAPAPLGPARADGCVHAGDLLQLVHAHSGAVLAVDVSAQEMCAGGLQACVASASRDPASQAPVARSTFRIALVPLEELGVLEPCWEGEDVLRFGQKLRLLVNPAAQAGGDDPAAQDAQQQVPALFSCRVTPTCAARSRHQLVGFAAQPVARQDEQSQEDHQRHAVFDSVWQVAPINPADVLAAEGQPVPAGAAVLLIHCATQAPLALDEYVCLPSDYGGAGSELGVSCHAVSAHGKQLVLEHARKGEELRTLPKATLSDNHWVFVTAA